MAEFNELVKVAVDAHRGNVTKYSVGESQDVLRNALIEMNGGSTKLNYRDIRDGKCNGMFTLIETILANTVVDGLRATDWFNALVEYRNYAEGDSPIFRVKDSNLYTVAEAANGTQAIRRQRLHGHTDTTIPTRLYTVKIYEELNRILANRVDFNEMISDVSRSFQQQMLETIFSAWFSATANDLGGAAYFPVAGSYSEDALLDVIAHVEAASDGKTAIISGTKKALRKLTPSLANGETYKDSMYNTGFCGMFYGCPVMAIPQRHQVGTTNFVMPDDTLTIVAGDEKPIKVVHEGSPLIIQGDLYQNMDLTQEYMYADKFGVGIILAGGNSGIGRYKFTN